MHHPSRSWLGVVLAVGILAVSTSAILVRLAMGAAGETGLGFSLVLAASRLSLAALCLVPTWRSLHQTKPTARAFT